jgi:hypothetical protein
MALYFLVALQNSEAKIQAALFGAKIPAESLYTVEPGKWIIESPATTSKEFSNSLGVVATEWFLVVPVTGYFGRAQPDLWEWIAAKITARAIAV